MYLSDQDPFVANFGHRNDDSAVLEGRIPEDRVFEGRMPEERMSDLDDVALLATEVARAARERMPSPGLLLSLTRSESPEKAPEKAGESFGAGDYVKHYQLIRELGRGGMGVVYLARDVKLARRVAIKFLLGAHDKAGERFMAEARVTARCRHDNIVVIHDIDEHQDIPFMVLEHLQGHSFRELFCKQRVTPQRAVELIIPVVRALKRAHQEGIVHRDLKPGNVFLTDSGTVKVLDFGIAKLMSGPLAQLTRGNTEGPDEPHGADTSRRATVAADIALMDTPSTGTKTGALVGTVPYMSPEQLRGGDVGPQSDLWAVGLILYELIAGRHPLPDHGAVELMDAVIARDRPMPRIRDVPDIALPDPLADAIDRCLLKDRTHRTASAAALLAELESLAPNRAVTLSGDENPFPGLAAFQETDIGRFFGRSHDIAMLSNQLRGNPFIALVGPSGTGKSSLVRAGIIPALKRSGEGWDAYVIRPGRNPLAALTSLLESWRSLSTSSLDTRTATDENQSAGLMARLRVEPGYLGATLRNRAGAAKRRILLFVDQLEEIYTLQAGRGEREAFFACLAGVADDATSPLRVIATCRSDYVDRLAEDRELSSQTQLTIVRPMQRDDLHDALVKPVEAMGFAFESAELVDRMLDELDATAEPLPLLQFAASQLWERRDRSRHLLTETAYRAIGGVAGALASHAEAVLNGMPTRDQQVARETFERLVTPERTRALATMDELRESSRHPAEAVEKVVHHLVQMRLLIVDTNVEGTSVDIAHEALISEWPTLGRWLDENADDAAFLTQLRTAAAQWVKSGRDEGLLWRGEAAGAAKEWHERHAQGGAPLGLGAREERYLDAVLSLAEGAQRRRRRVALGAFAALIAVAMVLAYLTVRARSEAENARIATATAQDQKELAESAAFRASAEARRARNANRLAAAELSKDDPTTVVALLRELEPGPVAAGWSGLALWALSSGVATSVLHHPQGVNSVDVSPDGEFVVSGSWDNRIRIWDVESETVRATLSGHDAAVTSVSFSPDGWWLVSASEDHTARIWNLAAPQSSPVVLRGHEGPVLTAAFDPEGRRVVTASVDQTARVWQVAGSADPIVLRGHGGRVTSAHFDPTGTRIVTSSWDKTVRVWPADGNAEPVILRGHEGSVLWASFSPDGRRIASGSEDNTIRIWTADGEVQPLVLHGHNAPVLSVAFSPESTRVVSTSYDKTVKIWNATGVGAPRSLQGHDAGVMSARFSPDGNWLVSGANDKTVRIWSAVDDWQHLVLHDHDTPIFQAAFSPDGDRIVSASEDKSVRIWRADGMGEPRVLRGHEGVVMSATFSPDGKHVASGSWDQTVRIWTVETGSDEARVLRGHRGEVLSVAYSPDGERIASASADKTIRVWPAAGEEPPLVLVGHGGPVYSAAFSPDGRRIVSTSLDKTVRVWPADGSGDPIVLRGHPDWIWWAAFSPDGRQIVTSCNDGNIRIWNADGEGQPELLRGHDGPVYSVSFSPDGTRILSTSADKTVRVWNADGSGQPLILRGHTDNANRGAFSPDGRRIVSASHDHTVRVWNLPRRIERDDPRLWNATRYCLSVDKRRTLLGDNEAMARVDLQRCRQRVAATRSASR